MSHAITVRRDNDITRTNLQENRCILNQITHIQAIVNKLISIPKKTPTPDHIGYVVRSTLRSECYH